LEVGVDRRDFLNEESAMTTPATTNSPTRSRHNEEKDIAELRNKAGEIGQGLSDMANIAVDVGRGQVERIRNAAAASYHEAKDKVVTCEEAVESYVHDRPIKALLIAAGIGIVIAMVLRRR